MATFTHKCPHCITEHIGLKVVAANNVEGYIWTVNLLCPKCKMPSGALIVTHDGTDSYNIVRDLQTDVDITSKDWRVRNFWPAVPAPNVPNYLPPDVARIFLQAERNFPIEGNEEAAGTMYRKALDIGLKKVDPTASGMLGPRIKKLAKDGKLTSDIAEWSDHIRDIGNDAAHEEEPITREELIPLRNFTEMVLSYLFTLPNMVRKRRGETLGWNAIDPEI